MKNKRFLSFLLIFVLCLSLSAAASADFGYEEYILNPEQLTNLYGESYEDNNALAAEISNTYGIVISLAVVDDILDNEPQAVADSIYMEYFGDGDCIMLLYFDNQMEPCIALYGKAIELITQDDGQRLMEAFNSMSYYDDCTYAYLIEAGNVLAEKLASGQLVLNAATDSAEQLPEEGAEEPAPQPEAEPEAEPEAGPEAIPEQRLKPLLVDEAGLLTEDEAAEILELLNEISERRQLDVALVTMPNFGGMEPQAFADDFYDYQGYGYGESDDGILFAMDMENRDWAITNYGYGISAFTDNGQRYLTEQFLSYISDGNYYEGFKVYAQTCDELIGMALDGEPYDKEAKGTDKSFWINLIPFSLLIGFVIAFFGAKRHKGKLESVHEQYAAGNYTRAGSQQLWCSEDRYLRRDVSRRKREKESSSSGSSGGSSTHTSSSGRSHGGSSGKF